MISADGGYVAMPLPAGKLSLMSRLGRYSLGVY